MTTADDGLLERLSAVVSAAPGRLGLAVRLPGGRRVDLGSDRVVPSASTIKVPVLVAALQACASGRLELDSPVRLPDAGDRVGGSGPLVLLPSLTHLTLRELLALMVCLSDNDATNVVIDLVGFAAVATTLAGVPTRATHLRRRLMDADAAAQGRQNTTTAADLADLLVALREGRLLDAVHTGVALDVLTHQQFREGLPAYLPAEVTVASKTGEIHGVRADMALIEGAVAGRYAAVAVVATGLARDPSGSVADESSLPIVGTTGSDRGTSVLPTFAEIGEIVHRGL